MNRKIFIKMEMSPRAIPAVVISVLMFFSSVAFAEVPASVTYSGRLTDGTGWGESTVADLTFYLCTEASGDIASCPWSVPARSCGRRRSSCWWSPTIRAIRICSRG